MRRVLLVLALLGAGLVSAPQSEAQQPPAVLLIMDASGSMNRDSGNGTSLIDEAKAALEELVYRLPDDANVGLRVYGATASSDDPKAVGCADSELVIPVGPIDRKAMLAVIDDYTASGWTPIGSSLQLVLEDLGKAGGTIILVSDGVDTCAPPEPCEVAQQLAEDGFLTAIHTVGLALEDQAAVDQLQCIADVAGGTFTDVENARFLLESLSGVVTAAIEGPNLSYVLGGLTRELAPVLDLRGWESNLRWLVADVEGAIQTGETRWLAVDLPGEGYQLSASATIDWQPEAGPEEYLEIQIFDDSGTAIGMPHEVLGVVVDVPSRLFMVDAAGYAWTEEWYPAVQAVTDPRSMSPAWDQDADWFQPTVGRFADAGLNGGMYEMWKSEVFSPTLPQGRYYAAVTWVSDRSDVTRIENHFQAYPPNREVVWATDWRRTGDFLIDDGSERPLLLDMAPWSGEPRSGAFGDPIRSVEVWATLEAGVSREYTVELAEGEVALMAWHVVEVARVEGEEYRFEVQVSHPRGPVQVGDVEFGSDGRVGYQEVQLEGFPEGDLWVAPWDGEYRLTATVTGDTVRGAAVSLTVFVFSPPDEPEPTGGALPDSVMRALRAGLDAVRAVADR